MRGTRSIAAALACVFGGVLGGNLAMAQPPSFIVTSVAQTGQFVPGVGTINGPLVFSPPGQGGRGTLRISVNASGSWLLHIDTPNTSREADEALLRAPTGLDPWVAEGVSGYLTAPTSSYVATALLAQDLNAAGDAVLALGLAPDEFSFDQPTSGIYFNRGRVIVQEGSLVTINGVAPGSTWEPLDADVRVALTDTRNLLVVARVREAHIVRRVAVVLTLDTSGAVLASRLVAKESGPVGNGPATWTAIAPGAHASAINESGVVVLSGRTSENVSGIWRSDALGTGQFVATTGSPSPQPAVAWGDLYGVPVDINGSGVVAFRGLTADGDGQYTETTDAGDVVDAEDRTFGNGPLNLIAGTLSDEHDVDMFRITVTDAAAFSATTVPAPASGFAGAAFDSVLTLIAEPGNGTRVRNQSDDAGIGTVQSSISNLGAITGRQYYLAISTPKSRALARVSNFATASFPKLEALTADPSDVIASGGGIYWPDPSRGVVGRFTSNGVSLAPSTTLAVTPFIAIDPSASKLYWIDRGVGGAGGGPKLRRAELDGSSPQDLVTSTAFGDIGINDSSGLALDLINGKVYWSRSISGEINRANLDGSNRERVIQDYPPTGAVTPAAATTGTFAPGRIAIDAVGGKVYWINAFLNTLERANLNGTQRETVIASANASDLAVHAGKLYWTDTQANRIRRSALDGSQQEEFIVATAPQGLDIDAASSTIVWTNTSDRTIWRSPLGAPAPQLFATIQSEVGSRGSDGLGATGTFDSWQRVGAAGTGPLPYQIKLTGATFQYPRVIIAKDSTKVAATGDVLPGIAPNRIAVLSSPGGPIRISDRGDVLWTGFFHAPTIFTNFVYDGLFFNGEKLLESQQVVTSVSQRVINFVLSADAIDVSRDGRFAGVLVNMQDPPYNFTPQRDNALVLEFSLPPACMADFDGSGTRTSGDIFVFLNAWFASDPRADVDGVGGVAIADVFFFINAWFVGC
ncbi:MAG: hypothetical protein K2W85_02470 [Phycisphaerales bacterium]|nr:hypothetical protein [Phycisphaerales bacterium]